MKRIIFFVFLAVVVISCKKEGFLPIEPGIYEAYQQGVSEIVTVTKSSYTGSDAIVEFKGMDERFKFPTIFDKNIKTGKPIGSYFGFQSDDVSQKNGPLEYILTVGENGKATFKSDYRIATAYNISRKGSQLLLSSTVKGSIVRLSPEGGFAVVSSNDKDYGKYTAIRGEIEGETIILYFYDAQINGRLSSHDDNYLDIDGIRTAMDQDGVLEFIRKAIYLKKR